MLPGAADSHGRFVQVTSAALPHNVAPSSTLTFDPSLSHLIAAAAEKSASRYEEPANWPDVFSPGAGTAPPAGGGSSGGQVSPSLPAAPAAPSVEPSGGGGGWAPVILPPSGGGGAPVSPPSVVPDVPAPIFPPAIPDAPVVISKPVVDAPIVAPVPDGGTTLLMLGLSAVVCAALRKRRPQS